MPPKLAVIAIRKFNVSSLESYLRWAGKSL